MAVIPAPRGGPPQARAGAQGDRGGGAPQPRATADVTVLDWGIGGVDLWRRLRDARPDLAVRYRSDAGFAPWGTVPTATLRARIRAIVAAEEAAGTRVVWVACNAGSTVLPHLARAPSNENSGDVASTRLGAVDVLGVITPGVRALVLQARGGAGASASRRPVSIGVVGGQRTVRSGAWARPLRAAGLRVRQRVAQPLSARIEAGDPDGPQTRALVRRLCRPLRAVDALVLACTHYPAAREAFAAALPGVALVDPGDAALASALAHVAGWASLAGSGSPAAVTTGDPAATRAAALRAFGVDLGVVTSAPLTGGPP